MRNGFSAQLAGEILMTWHLDGTFFENCNCDVVCPCTVSMALPADNDRCNVLLVFHVKSGEVEGLDVSGLSVAILADTPRVMEEGNWRIGMLMDAAASSHQVEALVGVFSGKKGGPMEAMQPLVGEMLGIETAMINYVDDGVRHAVTIGDFVEVEIEDLVSPADGGVERLTGIDHPANSTVTVAQAKRSRVDAFGIGFSGVEKNGHSATFSWGA